MFSRTTDPSTKNPAATGGQTKILDLVEGNDITRLDILIDGRLAKHFLNKSVDGHEVVDDRQHDLELLDAIAHRHKLSCENEGSVSTLSNCCVSELQ